MEKKKRRREKREKRRTWARSLAPPCSGLEVRKYDDMLLRRGRVPAGLDGELMICCWQRCCSRTSFTAWYWL